jgi:hypothetical protein
VPAFRNEPVAFPSPLRELLPRLCDVLVNGGAGDSAVHLRDALIGGDIDAESLLRVSFGRDQKAIRTSSIHMGLAPDLVWLIGELGSSPLAHHLQSNLLTSADLQERVRGWDRGYCPCCGSWPALIEVLNGLGRPRAAREGGPERRSATCEGDARTLRCSFCAASWELKTHRCVYCGHAGDRFVTAAPDMTRTDRRVELCGNCGSYTKVLDVAVPTPFPLLALEDLASLDLDQGAMGREYRRPSLVDLDAIEPPVSPRCS